jgi:cytochrome c peroxidase
VRPKAFRAIRAMRGRWAVSGIAFGSVVAIAACTMGAAGSGQALHGAYRVSVPLGLDLVAPVPADNALTADKIALGRKLFLDPELSADRSRSCASCHQPRRYFTDGRARPVGVSGRRGARNVPSILNAAYGHAFLWDGRAESLEAQVLRPIQGKDELGLRLEELTRRLEAREDYREDFRDAFGDPGISANRIARSLASYVRTLRSGDAPIDHFLHGDSAALSPDAQRGFRLFVGRANCGVCHLAPLFTDHRFHNTGVSWGSGDAGRYAVTGQAKDMGAFKTPSLRNVARTAPYMHDGSLATLEEVIAHYDDGGTPNPSLDEEVRPLRLTAAEKRRLIAFLEALTGARP